MRKFKKGLKRTGKLAQKGAKRALPIAKAVAPIASDIAVEVVPGVRVVRIAHAILKAKRRAKYG